MVVLQHPTGNANVRNAAEALVDANMLSAFVTTIAVRPNAAKAKIYPELVRKWIRRRSYAERVIDRTITHWPRELARLLLLQLRCRGIVERIDSYFSVQSVYESLDKYTAKVIQKNPKIQAVYCYERGALSTFRQAKRLGIKTIYELPTPYWRLRRDIMQKEYSVNPTEGNFSEVYERHRRAFERTDLELEMAELVVVPSKFVADSLALAPARPKNLVIIPYGAQPRLDDPDREVSFAIQDTTGRLKVLFVGNIRQTKGISYLADATRDLPQVSTTLIGALPSRITSIVEELVKRSRYLGTLPNSEVLTEMQRHDVLILPTLFEGLALVLVEAMSQGLVVITTPNCGLAEFIISTNSGFVVPVRDSRAIAEKLRFLFSNRPVLNEMKVAARNASKILTWEKYRMAAVDNVSKLIGE